MADSKVLFLKTLILRVRLHQLWGKEKRNRNRNMAPLLLVVVVGAAVAILTLVQVNCDTCGGVGTVPGQGSSRVTCERCAGKGEILPQMKTPSNVKSTFSVKGLPCMACGGKGYREVSHAATCPACDGRAHMPLYQALF
jgi:DnaJ-class molecular chaperone